MSVNQDNSRIAKNTLLLYFRMFFLIIVSLYTSRIVLEVLGVEDFGIYNVVGSVVTLFAFLSGAMASATQRFLSFEIGKGEEGDVPRVFSAILIVLIGIAIVIFIIAETIGLYFFYEYLNIPDDRVNAAFWVYQLSIVSFTIKLLQVPYNASIIAYEKMGIYAYISIFEVFFLLAIVFFLKWIIYEKLILYALLISIVTFVVALCYFITCRLKFESCRYKSDWDVKLIKELSSYSGWSLFGSLAFVAKTQGVNILLNLFFGPTVNAARAISFQLQSALQSFILNFQTAVKPQIIKLYATQRFGDMQNLVFKSSKYSFLLMLFLSLPVITELDYLLNLWLPVVPKYSQIFSTLILIEISVDSFSGPLMVSVQATGKIKKYQIIIGGVLLLNLPISFTLLKLNLDPPSVFFASIILTVTAFCYRLLLVKRILNFNISLFLKEVIWRSFVVLVLSAVIVSLIHFSINTGIVRLLIVGIVSSTSIIMLIYLLAMDNSEKLFFEIKFKQIKSRLKLL